MKNKIRLPFQQLKNEFTTIISIQELKSIVGGTYGGPSYSWDTNEGFLNNVNEMIFHGLFDYLGNSGMSGTYDTEDLYSGTGSPPQSLVGSSPLPWTESGSGSGSWTGPGSGQVYLKIDPPSSLNMFSFGSANIGGSSIIPSPLVGSFGNFRTEFVMPKLGEPSIKIFGPDGVNLNINYSGGKISFGIQKSF